MWMTYIHTVLMGPLPHLPSYKQFTTSLNQASFNILILDKHESLEAINKFDPKQLFFYWHIICLPCLMMCNLTHSFWSCSKLYTYWENTYFSLDFGKQT